MYRGVFDIWATLNRIANTHVIRKKLRVESRQTSLTARACATHLMFALTHWSMPLTHMVHSWTLSLGKLRTLMSMQIMPSALDIGQWKTSRVDGPLGKLIVTKDVEKNHVLVGKERVCDQEFIYACIIGLLASSREINFNYMLEFELAAYPPSMSNADGKTNVATSKSPLKHKLQVNISERNCPISDTMIMMCLHFSGLSHGRLVNCVSTWTFVHQALRRADVILVFERYFPNSINTFTRTQRSWSSRVYKLTPDAQAPAKEVVLTNTKNKIQLNAMLTEDILDPGCFTEATQTHTLTIAGVRDVPVEITGGLRIDRHDLRSTPEEADILIA